MAALPELKIVQMPLTKLKPDPENVRVHGERNMQSIIGSLRQFGQVEPLVVQKGTGQVIGGHGRLEAMRTLGWKKAAVVEVPLHGLDAQALGLALNRTGELAAWDGARLRDLIGRLHTERFDVEGIGFSAEQMERFAAPPFHKPEDGAEPDPEPVRDATDAVRAEADGAREMDEGDFQQFRHLCPKCGFEFDKPIQVASTDADTPE